MMYKREAVQHEDSLWEVGDKIGSAQARITH